MTVSAEFVKPRGAEEYGANKIVLHPTPRPHLLIDDEGKGHKVDLPQDLPVFQDRTGRLLGVRTELRVLSSNRAALTSDEIPARTLEGRRISNHVLLVNLPGVYGEVNPALVRWERDLPLVSQAKRGAAELRRRARLILG